MILRGKIVLPIAEPPIDNGAVAVVGGFIAAVGKWSEIRRGPWDQSVLFDAGDAAILPGLINSHCHLDYSDMAGMIPPTRTFADWIKSILTLKSEWSYSEYAQSWLNGAGMLLRHGVTTVADTESVPELLPEVWEVTPLHVISFIEMTCVRGHRPARSVVADALAHVQRLASYRHTSGLSPHAPYSTTPELLRTSAMAAAATSRLLSIHAAESAEEFMMFTGARGCLHDWLGRNGRNQTDCGLGTPVAHLARHGCLGPSTLVIHANCLEDSDIQLLADSRSSVVHCPRSHDYFDHSPFRATDLAQAGINLCLGTDSLASVRKRHRAKVELDLFEEMGRFHASFPGFTSREVLAMTTTNPAAALQLAGQRGVLAPGAAADIVTIPCSAGAKTAEEAVINHRGVVTGSLIGGAWQFRTA